MLLDYFIGLGESSLSGDFQVVSQSGATTAFDCYVDADVIVDSVFLGEIFDLAGGFFGDCYREFDAILGDGHIFLPGS